METDTELYHNETAVKEQILAFIEEIKEEFLYFLKENIRSYPVCCDRANQILMSYIKERFGIGEIKAGRYTGNQDSKFHVWGEIEGEIVDFTYFQFLKDKQTIYLLSKTKEKNVLYHEMVNKTYGHVILNEEYKSKLQEKTTVSYHHLEIAKREKSFSSYLHHFKPKF